jgi:hypothetical protein
MLDIASVFSLNNPGFFPLPDFFQATPDFFKIAWTSVNPFWKAISVGDNPAPLIFEDLKK